MSIRHTVLDLSNSAWYLIPKQQISISILVSVLMNPLILDIVYRIERASGIMNSISLFLTSINVDQLRESASAKNIFITWVTVSTICNR